MICSRSARRVPYSNSGIVADGQNVLLVLSPAHLRRSTLLHDLLHYPCVSSTLAHEVSQESVAWLTCQRYGRWTASVQGILAKGLLALYD